jgi:hypothetical protein
MNSQLKASEENVAQFFSKQKKEPLLIIQRGSA